MRRIQKTAVAAASALLMGLAACSSPADVNGAGTGAPGQPAAGGPTLNFAIGSDPLSLNPINVGDRWGLTTVNMVYSPLARVQPDGTVTPDLAKTIDIAPDGRSVTATLREDVLWSDGEQFTADDVVFTYTEKAKVENGNADALLVGGKPITATAVDDYTVRFDLPAVSAAAGANLATEIYIIPEHVYAGADLSAKQLDPIAVGTGPYALEEFRPGELLRLRANEKHYGGAPKIANLNARIVGNPDTVKAALQTGEIDGSVVVPAELQDLQQAPIRPYIYSEGRVGYLGAIASKPALSDVRVRQALFFALDRQQMNIAAYLAPEYFENAQTILPPSNPYFSTDGVETYPTDKAKATELLTAAGASDLRLTLAHSATDAAQKIQATLIQQQLSEVGVDVQLSALDSAAMSAALQEPGTAPFDLFLNGYIMGLDPDQYRALFGSDGSSNFFDYDSPKADELFSKGATTLNKAERTKIYADLQRQIAQDAVFYPIVDNKRILAFNQRIDGVEAATPVPIFSLERWERLTVK